MIIIGLLVLIGVMALIILHNKEVEEKKELENLVLSQLDLSCWPSYKFEDYSITVKSRKALEKYDELSFFKEDTSRVDTVDKVLKERAELERKLTSFLANNEFQDHKYYYHIVNKSTENQ